MTAFILSLHCCSFEKNLNISVNQGVVSNHTIRFNLDSTEDVKDFNFKLYYLDSTVIIEFVTSVYDFGIAPAQRKPPFLKTLYFTYLDLRTLMCQDYRKFDTSAIPESNYKANKRTLLWNFFQLDSNENKYKTSQMALSDTTVDEKIYKRFLINYNISGDTSMNQIMYLTDKYNDSLFHFSVFTDRLNFPFKIWRIETYSNYKLQMFSYNEQLSKKLNDFEQCVFQKWKLNSVNTKLPVISTEEVIKKISQYGSN